MPLAARGRTAFRPLSAAMIEATSSRDSARMSVSVSSSISTSSSTAMPQAHAVERVERGFHRRQAVGEQQACRRASAAAWRGSRTTTFRLRPGCGREPPGRAARRGRPGLWRRPATGRVRCRAVRENASARGDEIKAADFMHDAGEERRVRVLAVTRRAMTRASAATLAVCPRGRPASARCAASLDISPSGVRRWPRRWRAGRRSRGAIAFLSSVMARPPGL